ncbi:MAG: DUF501 domain-containing protein [Candidatus Bipolaricaulota bacterium]|nr:DUF501 domain-containing protein [Candidatus Bipolaricaulota bacterium]MCS7274579.1 DUF501 domain-containing protein [Candidatus Bipolaricaulota bacterium]MDW8110990.1 DUF501 domain-containing protein [Candidatus Bipolaricaulota bacterium]MDW8329009.1 DUF501 domain-containing protein [Candidatus Bipolaricaulota bacterium]
MLNDQTVIARQLGRPPRGKFDVSVRCPWGYPAVIRVAPLLRDGDSVEPFPTLFWLTCPILIEQLSRLEERGLIDQLESELARDPQLRHLYEEDHRRYTQEREALLSDDDRQTLSRLGWLDALRSRGIAGIADRTKVKCLHAQYAFHLARGGLIGRWLEERFRFSWCSPTEIRCARFTSP